MFADIVRKRGRYPAGDYHSAAGLKRPITVWCSNDYLGMGQHPKVIAAMHEAIERRGRARAARAISPAPRIIMWSWSASSPICMARKRRLLFTSGFVSNDATLATLAKVLPG